MNILLHRIYGEEDAPTGYRVLCDRLWPRGISKREAALDGHWKDLAPSDGLRRWFDHDPEKWGEFRKKYLHELSENKEAARERLGEVDGGTLVLLYGAKDKEHTHAKVLKEYLNRLG